MTGIELFTIAGAAVTLGDVFTVVGGIIGAASSLFGGSAQADAAETQAAIARQQAQIAQDNANAEAERIADENRRRLGLASASYSASGITKAGTPLEVLGDLAAEGELDKQIALYRGKVSSNAYLNQAALDELNARRLRFNSYFEAGGSLLTTAAKFGKGYVPPKTTSQGSGVFGAVSAGGANEKTGG